jgi:hypothetical protein
MWYVLRLRRPVLMKTSRIRTQFKSNEEAFRQADNSLLAAF